jgi:hypothetical protein
MAQLNTANLSMASSPAVNQYYWQLHSSAAMRSASTPLYRQHISALRMRMEAEWHTHISAAAINSRVAAPLAGIYHRIPVPAAQDDIRMPCVSIRETFKVLRGNVSTRTPQEKNWYTVAVHVGSNQRGLIPAAWMYDASRWWQTLRSCACCSMPHFPQACISPGVGCVLLRNKAAA